jgi:hypothetical protein
VGKALNGSSVNLEPMYEQIIWVEGERPYWIGAGSSGILETHEMGRPR